MDVQQLRQHLFNDQTRLYGVLDGVMVPDLPNRLYEGRVPNYCLVPGELTPGMVHASPYLVYLSPDSKFADWVLSEAVGKHWGIFLQTRRSMLEMRKHFRSLLQVYDERGNPLKFRFYDPRVLGRFLPMCNGGELKTLFSDVDAFFSESDDGQSLIRYQTADGTLSVKDLGQEVH